MLRVCSPLREKLKLSEAKPEQLFPKNGCEEFCRRVRKSGRLINCPRESTRGFFEELIELLLEEEDFKISFSTKPDFLIESFKNVVTRTFERIATVDYRGFDDIELPMTIEGQTSSEIAQNLEKVLMNSGWKGEIDISAKKWRFKLETSGDKLVLRGGIEYKVGFEVWCKVHQKIAPLILEWI